MAGQADASARGQEQDAKADEQRAPQAPIFCLRTLRSAAASRPHTGAGRPNARAPMVVGSSWPEQHAGDARRHSACGENRGESRAAESSLGSDPAQARAAPAVFKRKEVQPSSSEERCKRAKIRHSVRAGPAARGSMRQAESAPVRCRPRRVRTSVAMNAPEREMRLPHDDEASPDLSTVHREMACATGHGSSLSTRPARGRRRQPTGGGDT